MPTEPLAEWTRSALSSLWTLPTDTDVQAFSSSFDNVFSQSVNVQTNGETLSRDEAQEKIVKRRGPMALAAKVEWKECTAVPKDESRPNDAGTVTGEYVVTRSMKWLIRASHAQTQMFVKMEATIEQDESVTTPDRRRITRLVESVEDKSVPIHLPHPRAAHPPATDKGAPEKKSLGDLD